MRKYISISENRNECYRRGEGGLRPNKIPVSQVGTNIDTVGYMRSIKKDLFWKEVKVGYFGYVIVYY